MLRTNESSRATVLGAWNVYRHLSLRVHGLYNLLMITVLLERKDLRIKVLSQFENSNTNTYSSIPQLFEPTWLPSKYVAPLARSVAFQNLERCFWWAYMLFVWLWGLKKYLEWQVGNKHV